MIAPKKLLAKVLKLRQKKFIFFQLVEIKEPEPIDKDTYKTAHG
jgi:hypothetical protein